MTTETPAAVVDKSEWGAGPWQDEPDRVEWDHAGLPCLATRGPSGHWCGYAAVPPGHPLHGKSRDDPPVTVHCGLTYANACEGQICHVPKPGEPDNVWWFGFDCAHAGDLSPAYHARYLRKGYPFDDQPYEHAKAVALQAENWTLADVYRTLDYVKAETNQLAEQLSAITA